MQNNLFFLFGYVRISLSEEDVKGCIDAFRKGKIISRFFSDGRVDISIFHWRKAQRILHNKIVFFNFSIGGACAVFPFLKGHIAIPLGIALLLLFYSFLYGFVFDVRVEGNERLTTEQVWEQMEDAGLYVGAKWRTLSFSELEGRVLSNSDSISWINVHRRGMVAYVTIKEKETVPKAENVEGFANVVSDFDGVVEEVIVKSGSGAVTVGQTVKKGDLLISAFDSNGHPTFAKGEVYARVFGSFTVFIPRQQSKTVAEECVLVGRSIKIFNFFINIFKNYRNLQKEYDIIEDRRRILLSDDKPLPLTLVDTYAVLSTKEEITYTDEELISLARSAQENAMLSYLSSGEIVFVRTQGEFTEDGYCMKSEICILTQIGVSEPLRVE